MACADQQDNWQTARWSLLLQEYDMTVNHKRGVLNTNADCLSRHPQQSTGQEPTLPDWSKGNYNLTPSTALAFMATNTIDNTQLLQSDTWEDTPVLHFLRTHQYQEDQTALNKDRIYRRAKVFRWLSHILYKLHEDGPQMLLIPPQGERQEVVKKVHRDMGHFGIYRVLNRLRKNY